MYQGRNSSCVRLLTGWNRARNRVLLFLSRSASLRQSFESFERVINKHPVLVYYFSVLRHWCRCCNHSEGAKKKKKKRKLHLILIIKYCCFQFKNRINVSYTYVFPVSHLEIRRNWKYRRWNVLRLGSRQVFPWYVPSPRHGKKERV